MLVMSHAAEINSILREILQPGIFSASATR
jgi:hypothetical protein